MSISLKIVSKKAIIILGCLYSLLYFVATLTPFIDPSEFSYITFLGLLFPYLFVGMIVWLIVCFFIWRNYIWLFGFLTFLGYKNISACFAFNIPTTFTQQKNTEHIRVLNWNVQDFLDSQIYTDTLGNARRDIIAFIKNTNADIVCIQDFTERISPAFRSSVNDVRNTFNYPNYFFSADIITQHGDITTKYGTAIYSKYPIIDSGRIVYKESKKSESLAYVDIKKGNDTIRVFTTHLQSMYIKLELTNEALADETLIDDMEFLRNNPKPHQRIRHFDWIHAQQAHLVKNQLNKCTYPFIFCADLNSVPSSYTYHTVKSGLTDAFTAKGFGIGNTYNGFAPTLRIDVVFMSKHFTTKQYYSPRIYASDHFPIVTDIELTN
jgi:endonuclease/exonuclease/phosphatase family metal-dependent hydrolase